MQLPPQVQSPFVEEAINRIYRNFGDSVSVKDEAKELIKFGSRPDVGSSGTFTIAQLGSGEAHETYLTGNTIDKVSSSSGDDTEELVVEGHTIDGSGNFTFVTQTVTLTGQTAATLSTPLARCSRAYNNGTNDLVGTVYVHVDDTLSSGVPQTASKVYLTIPAGKNQSFKAATTISQSDYWIITGGKVGVQKKTTAVVDFFLEIRLKGKVFRQQDVLTASSTGANGIYVPITPHIIVPPNADIRVTATASTTAVECNSTIYGYLAN